MELRKASIEKDLENLAEMNHSLIADEGHTNSMNLDQLGERMELWLKTGYEAEIISVESDVIGYCLWREYPEYTYIRQLYIKPEIRRKGYARKTIEWLRNNMWNSDLPQRMEVLVENRAGIEFWRKVGFRDYCISMEHDDA